jgi:hypothetical protein
MRPFVTTAPFQYSYAIRMPGLDACYLLSANKTPVFIDLISSPLASRLHALLWRLGMISLAGNTAVSIFRFEVSDWDKRQSFFVEKSELHWGEQSGKQIALSSAIPDGAVVFLRLLPSLCPTAPNRSPIRPNTCKPPWMAATVFACILSSHASIATPPPTAPYPSSKQPPPPACSSGLQA